MRIYLIFCLVCIGISNPIQACINVETKDLADGTMLISDERGAENLAKKYRVPYGYAFTEKNLYRKKLADMDSLWRKTGDIKYYSDCGVLYTLLEEYGKAKDVYLAIEKIQAGRYSTASNLGTVYELLGENELALKWIKKAVQINPGSHMQSEWIHVNILKAKLNGDTYINSDSLIGMNFGNGTVPVMKQYDSLKLVQLRNAIYYQLNERVSFIKPKDKIVAQLYFDLGNILYLLKDNLASENYQLAKEYGYSGHTSEKQDNSSANIQAAKENGYYSVYWILSTVVLSIIIILSIVFISKRKKEEQA